MIHSRHIPTSRCFIVLRQSPLLSFLIILPFLTLAFEFPVILFVAGSVSCAGPSCVGFSPTFTDVFDRYFDPEIGYYYPPALFHFFIALTVIVIAVWAAFFIINLRQVWLLYKALARDRVIRVPGMWASARHSITRDIVQQWMQPHEAPIAPVKVNKVQVRAHMTLASAKLCVNTESASSTIASPSNGLPLSPSGVSPISSAASSEYTLKFNLSTDPAHSCRIEVWFGIPLTTVSTFLSDYAKFKTRHISGGKVKSPTKSKGVRPHVASPAPGSVPVGDHAVTPIGASRRMDGRLVGGTLEMQPLPAQPGLSHTPQQSSSPPRTSPSNPRAPYPFSPESPPLSPRTRPSRSNRIAPCLTIDPNARDMSPLPNMAPSPHNSPSHVTAESESKHVSQLSLREKERGSLSQIGSRYGNNGGVLSLIPQRGNVTTPPPVSPELASPSALPLSPSGLPSPVHTTTDVSGLFHTRECLYALTPLLYPPGSKQVVSINFPQSWLIDTLDDPSRCPILIYLTPIASDSSSPSSPSAPSFAGGELTIVQFNPPPQSINARGKKSSSSPPPAALPAPALQAQVANDHDAANGNGDEAKEEEEAEADDGGDDDHKESEPLSPSGTLSPIAGLQDSVTVRVRFDRQLIVMKDETYEIEVNNAESCTMGEVFVLPSGGSRQDDDDVRFSFFFCFRIFLASIRMIPSVSSV